MTKPKTFFKYCESCGERFTPFGSEVKKCKKCKQKVYLLINLENKLNQFKGSLPEHNLLEKNHQERINKITNLLDKEVSLLKLDLKRK